MPNSNQSNILIILGGLPATGKTTIAKALANYYQATYLKIDTLEQTLKSSNKFSSTKCNKSTDKASYSPALIIILFTNSF